MVSTLVSKEASLMAIQETIILEIEQWIDANIDRPLRIDEVALRAGYPKWHLQRLF